MWDASGGPGMSEGPGGEFDPRPGAKGDHPGPYDSLIDAEREALSRSGRPVGKIALIKALREATGLGLREAKDAVEGYLARRDGRVPFDPGRPAGWIDDLLDAERAAALREDRPLTKILLIKALRSASPMDLRRAKDVVEDYLRRRGGEGLQAGGGGPFALLALLLLVALGLALWLLLGA